MKKPTPSPTIESIEWQDGSKYDGEAVQYRCHGLGIMRHPNGDRYEGQFFNGAMHGLGVYVWKKGILYRGEWRENHMEGCGVRMSKQIDGQFVVQEGQFVRDQFLGTFLYCPIPDARRVASEADLIASRANTHKFSESEEEFKEPALRFTQVEPSEKRRSWFDDIIKKLGKRSENNIN